MSSQTQPVCKMLVGWADGKAEQGGRFNGVSHLKNIDPDNYYSE